MPGATSVSSILGRAESAHSSLVHVFSVEALGKRITEFSSIISTKTTATIFFMVCV